MLTPEMKQIIEAAREIGWVLEPEAKRFLALAGLETPRFSWARDLDQALTAAGEIGYPVAAKVVSPQALHKSDLGGVAVGLEDEDQLREAYGRLSRIAGFEGVLVEEMVQGVELIVGAKVDFQFGPVVLLGLGGTGVEIFQDTAIRLAPLEPFDVSSMVACLKAGQVLTGHRGSPPVNLDSLTRLLVTFSQLTVELKETVESMDLNPVMCSPKGCLVADARIILSQDGPSDKA